MSQPDELLPVRDSTLREDIGDLTDRITLRNRHRVEHDAACQQFGEDFGRRHCGIQFVFAGAYLSFRLLSSSQPQKCRPAFDQLFPLKKGRHLLKCRSFRNHDDFGGRMVGLREYRGFSPLNHQIPGHAAEYGDDENQDQHHAQLHTKASLDIPNLRRALP